MIAAEETILLEKLTAYNDEQALQQLFHVHYPRLVRFAFSLLHNRPVAEEIAEDVFIKLWEKRAGLPVITNLKAYLLMATRNGVLNHQKAIKNQPYLNIEDVEVNLTASTHNPEERLISAQAIWQVNAAVNALPPQCRLIFQLVKEEGLKYREVAELLHLSVKTIETQMGLALRKIGETLLEASISLPQGQRRKK